MVVALAATPRESAGQADSLSPIFRRGLVEIAIASGIPRLDSTRLAPGVRREIRVYTGFGFGGYSMLRLWEDGTTVRGRLGTFWTIGEYFATYDSRAEERAGHARGQAYDARMRAFVDSVYGCRASSRSNYVGVCWLPDPPRTGSWTRLRAVLDSLRVNDIPYPVRPRMGMDGWGVLVEVRTAARYRSYWYWEPDSLSADPSERAARRIGSAVMSELARRAKPSLHSR